MSLRKVDACRATRPSSFLPVKPFPTLARESWRHASLCPPFTASIR